MSITNGLAVFLLLGSTACSGPSSPTAGSLDGLTAPAAFQSLDLPLDPGSITASGPGWLEVSYTGATLEQVLPEWRTALGEAGWSETSTTSDLDADEHTIEYSTPAGRSATLQMSREMGAWTVRLTQPPAE